METLEQSYSKPNQPNAATRNVDLMADELAMLGYISPELWAMALDEEDTHAAELLPAQDKMAYATVPRNYRQEDGDLVDKHNQHLTAVLDGGVAHIKERLASGVPGSDWELRRRLAERKNLDRIIDMPTGSVCLEISASPFDKPKPEQKAQHYTDLTIVRASFKGHEGEVDQYNYVLPISSLEFLRAVQSKLGRHGENQILASDELLENPIIEPVDQPIGVAAKKFDSLMGAALLEASVGDSAVRMIKKAIESRREAWQFITSEDNIDLHQELMAAMQSAALLPQSERAEAMDSIRIGFWRELIDRFRGRDIIIREGGVLMAAAARAVVDGDVYIACGSTVSAMAPTTRESAASRSQTVASLRSEIKGSGSCSACGAKGTLYGCGLCSRCNKKWCDVYEQTGKQLEIKELAYQNYGRDTETAKTSTGSLLNADETLKEQWARIGREVKQKQEIKKMREAESEARRREETELARVA